MTELLRSLHRFWPEVVLTVGLLLVVLVDTTRVRGRDVANWLLTMATLAAAFVLSVRLGTQSGGFNGSVLLHPDDPSTSGNEATVFDDDAADTLTGSAGLDWYFSSLGDIVQDRDPANETLTSI